MTYKDYQNMHSPSLIFMRLYCQQDILHAWGSKAPLAGRLGLTCLPCLGDFLAACELQVQAPPLGQPVFEPLLDSLHIVAPRIAPNHSRVERTQLYHLFGRAV